ncbi:MAG: Chemotaxis protein CheC -- inhibitor of MCP methylation, partial [uncultured Solirubrobacteraceae bacterium]
EHAIQRIAAGRAARAGQHRLGQREHRPLGDARTPRRHLRAGGQRPPAGRGGRRRRPGRERGHRSDARHRRRTHRQRDPARLPRRRGDPLQHARRRRRLRMGHVGAGRDRQHRRSLLHQRAGDDDRLRDGAHSPVDDHRHAGSDRRLGARRARRWHRRRARARLRDVGRGRRLRHLLPSHPARRGRQGAARPARHRFM